MRISRRALVLFGSLVCSRVLGQALATSLYTIAPCRVADTRNPVGPYGGPALAGGADRTFVIAGQCGIPSTARAVSFNFTITLPTALGDLRVSPVGAGLPLVSTLNWRPGQTRANNAVVGLGPNGDIVTHIDQSAGTVHFIIDVNGYFQTPVGDPIIAPDRTWTWVSFPDAVCQDGSTTGIGVNLNSSSNRAMIFLQGGGACWSDQTCNVLRTAVGGPFGQSQFMALLSSLSTGLFDRTRSSNPFKDYNYVFVPYCTGDIHAGNNVAAYPTQTWRHVGFNNITAYLRRIVPTFPNAQRIFLAGSSAGGLGATINWWQTQQAFGSIRVDLIDDSGPFMSPTVLAMGTNVEPQQRAQWNLASTLPPGCSACSTRLDVLFSFYANAFPNNRGALLSYYQDQTIRGYYGLTAAQFAAGLDELVTTQFDPNPNLKYFIAAGSAHTLFFTPSVSTGGVTVEQFLTLMANDSPSWASLHP